jgi:hypothetical protein
MAPDPFEAFPEGTYWGDFIRSFEGVFKRPFKRPFSEEACQDCGADSYDGDHAEDCDRDIEV